MKKIDLTNKQTAIVDDAEFGFLSKIKWYAAKGGNNYYAFTSIAHQKTYMHHLILPKKRGYHVDHINRNSLDNRKTNLRYCTCSENIANSKLRKDNRSGHKGIYKTKYAWLAQMRRNGILIHLGSFRTKAEAIKARQTAEVKL